MNSGGESGSPDDGELGEAGGGRYRLSQRIGAGGTAVVYRAFDLIRNRRVALKRLSLERQQNPAIRAQFEQEYVTLVQLSHPRIVCAYDYSVDTAGPYYTMELLDGGDLAQIAPADYRTACALARDVCSALSLVHSRRMVYRDLSVNNVVRQATVKPSSSILARSLPWASTTRSSAPCPAWRLKSCRARRSMHGRICTRSARRSTTC